MAALAAITGLGLSRLSREPIGTARDLAIEAIAAAVADAGLRMADVDGLLITKSPSASLASLPLHLRNDLALGPLRVLANVEAEGTSVVQAVQAASLQVLHGMARHVVCVFADARIEGGSSGSGYAKAMELTGITGWEADQGLLGPVAAYALAARRYLAARGMDEHDLGAYAIACRAWATRNPFALRREPLTLADYLRSRSIAEPLRLLDCAYPVNGAAAVVVSARAQAAVCPQPRVYVHGAGQGHAGAPLSGRLAEGASLAVQGAIAQAGITLADVGSLQAYDAFSSVGLELLEAYGFCGFGQSGDFVRSGVTSPGGQLPMNTGGGHLSGFYLQGMTPLVEAVVQARGHAGERQVDQRRPMLVTGVGGCLEYHAALVLGSTEKLS
jgi:acetyl-CoA acetyltransferase